jgi:hypothetical protein
MKWTKLLKQQVRKSVRTGQRQGTIEP